MSTSKLQELTGKHLRKHFGKYGLVENRRPDWLSSSKGERLELDFFIDKLSVAVEVQGKQHKEFTPHFHKTEHDYKEQLRRDREKKAICDKRGIVLFYVNSKSEIGYIVASIIEMRDGLLNNRYDEDEDVSRYKKPRKQKTRLIGIRQINKAFRKYEMNNNTLGKKGFNLLCRGIKNIFIFGELPQDEFPLLQKAVWLKKEIEHNRQIY